MSRIVYERLREICPLKRINEMSPDEVDKSVNIAFKLIGYTPNNLNKAMDRANAKSDSRLLYEFIYDVWRLDS